MKEGEDKEKGKGKKKKNSKKTRVGGHYLDIKRTTEKSIDRMMKESGSSMQREAWEGRKPFFSELNLTLNQERVLFGLWALQEKKRKRCFNVRATEFYEAMGLKKTSNGGYSKFETKQMDRALLQLNSILITIAYRSKEKGYDGVVRKTLVFNPATALVEVTYVGSNDERATTQDEMGDHVMRNLRYIRIALKAQLVADIDNYYRLIPSTLYEDIKYYNQKRGRRTVVQEPRFIEWLFAQRKDEVKVNRLALAKALKMRQAIEHREWGEIDQIIARCYEVAWNLDYLEKCSMEKKGAKKAKDTLWLKISRFPNLR